MAFSPSSENIDYSGTLSDAYVVHDNGVGVGSLLFEEADFNNGVLPSETAGYETGAKTATVDVDGAGAPQAISLSAVNGVTVFQDIVDEINTDVTGATASIVNGQIRVTSDTPEIGTIDIVDTSLFSDVGQTGPATVPDFVDIIKSKHLIDWESIGGPFSSGAGSQLQNLLEEFVNSRGGAALPLSPYSGFQIMNTGLESGVVTGLPSQTSATAGLQKVDIGGDIAGGDLLNLANETTRIQAVAGLESSLSGKFFTINTTTVDFYVWFDVDNGSVDPAPTGRTAIEIDVGPNTTATTNAGLIQTAIDGTAGFTATVSSDVVTVVHDVAGEVSNAVDVDSGHSVSVLRQGRNPGTGEVTDITTVADLAGSLAGSFFLLTAPGTEGNNFDNFYVWYDVAGSAETAEVVTVADVEGSLSGKRFHIDGDNGSETQASYVWFDFPTQAEITDVVVPAASSLNTRTTAAGVAGSSWRLNSGSENDAFYVWYSVEETEVTDATTVADVEGSLGGTHWLISGPPISATEGGTDYYVWYDFAAVAEETDITTPADVEGSLGGTHWLLKAANDSTAYYVWYDFAAVAEISNVTTVADVAGSLNSTFFLLDDPTTAYYVWYDVNSAGVDPTPGGTGITVALATNETANDVATATRAAIGAFGDFGTSGATNVVIITNANTGFATDVIDGSAATGFGFSTTTQGSATQADPAPGGTGLSVTIVTNDTATQVASKTQVVVNGEADFGASLLADVVTITNAATGFTTDAVDVDAGVGVSVTTQGSAVQVDPMVASRTGITVTILTNDADTAVATATRSAINGQAGADLSAGGAGATATVTNTAIGATLDAVDVDTGFAGVTVTTQGTGPNTDPGSAAFSIGPVIVLPTDADTAVAVATRVAVTASDFTAVGAGATVAITNAFTGFADNAVDVDASLVSITVTQEGSAAGVDPAPASKTGLTVTIAANDTAATIAGLMNTVVDASAFYASSVVTSTVTISSQVAGNNVPNAVDIDTTFTITTIQEGGPDPAEMDPAPAGRTGITVAILSGDDATEVATKTTSAVDAVLAFGATSSTNVITVTNANIGEVGDARDGNIPTGFSFDITTQGDNGAGYRATVQIDGGLPQTVFLIAANVTDYTSLVTAFNDQISGATASISTLDFVVTSNTTGSGSTIRIVNTNLFNNLLEFLTIDPAVDGLGVISFDLRVSIDDGTFETLTTTPTGSQTYGDLITDLGNPTGGALALVSNNMKITSSTVPGAVDVVSTVEIDPSSNLLSALPAFSGLDEAQAGSFDTKEGMDSTFVTGGNQSLSQLMSQHIQVIPTRPVGQINSSIYFDGTIFRNLSDGSPV